MNRKFCIIWIAGYPAIITHRAWFENYSQHEPEWISLTIHEARKKLREMMSERKAVK